MSVMRSVAGVTITEACISTVIPVTVTVDVFLMVYLPVGGSHSCKIVLRLAVFARIAIVYSADLSGYLLRTPS